MELFSREMKISVREEKELIHINSYLKDTHHEIKIHLAVQPVTMEIKDLSAEMLRVPYEVCPEALKNLEQLKGLKVKQGINRQVIELLGGRGGCVHVVDLLRESFTGAVQGDMSLSVVGLSGEAITRKLAETLAGTCIGYAKFS